MCFGISDRPTKIEDLQSPAARRAQRTAEIRARSPMPRIIVDDRSGMTKHASYVSVSDSSSQDSLSPPDSKRKNKNRTML